MHSPIYYFIKGFLYGVILTLMFVNAFGCTYTITLTVSLPSDPTPTVNLEPQPQTKPDMNL